METHKNLALVLDPSDNVATVLSNIERGDRVHLKGTAGEVVATEAVGFGHKIALRYIRAGESIIKYGQKIGYATVDIKPGDWVHLHSMASEVDVDFRTRIER